MCGIVGCSFEDRDSVKRALRLIAHRGPDGSRVLSGSHATLGAVRLAIMDRGRRALQPMSAEGVWAALNGEIYNFPELRQALEKAGHRFSTSCDTEVVLHAYREWGEDCFSRLEGMFAIAIVDKGIIHLARDRMGIKPLYYSLNEGNIIFGSEIKTILSFPGLSRDLDRDALTDYFRFRFVPGQRTLFRHIKRLPAGHRLRFADSAIHMEQLSPAPQKQPLDLKSALTDAVMRHLQGDAPIGIYLSGGLDSSIIAALASRQTSKEMHSYTIALSGSNDESALAASVAEKFGLTHHNLTFDPKRQDIISRIAWFQDDLVADPVLLANYQLAEAASKQVKVILCGEGADELFGGYNHYGQLRLLSAAMRIPRIVRSAASAAAARLPVSLLDVIFQYPASIGIAGRERTAAMLRRKSAEEAYFSYVSLFDSEERMPLRRELTGFPWPATLKNQPGKTLAERVMRFEQQEWLQHYILSKLDRMTMCCSLEGRVPYLSPEVVRIADSLPLGAKISHGSQKVCLRQAFRQELPAHIIKRRKYAFFALCDHESEQMLKEDALALLERLPLPRELDKVACSDVINRMDGSLIRQRQGFSVALLFHWLEHFLSDSKIIKPRNSG